MAMYARQPRRLLAQVSADVLVLVWVVLWWLLSRLAERTVLEVAEPVRKAVTTAGSVSGQFRDASEQAGRVPGIGEQLRQPFDAAAGSFTELVTTAEQQVRSIERLASLLGWLVFLLPLALVVVVWLPRRLRFYLQARAAQRYLDSSAALDVLALRTLLTEPLPVLTEIDPDPAGRWRSGDATVISKLADVELRRTGLGPRQATNSRQVLPEAPKN